MPKPTKSRARNEPVLKMLTINDVASILYKDKCTGIAIKKHPMFIAFVHQKGLSEFKAIDMHDKIEKLIKKIADS